MLKSFFTSSKYAVSCIDIASNLMGSSDGFRDTLYNNNICMGCYAKFTDCICSMKTLRDIVHVDVTRYQNVQENQMKMKQMMNRMTKTMRIKKNESNNK